MKKLRPVIDYLEEAIKSMKREKSDLPDYFKDQGDGSVKFRINGTLGYTSKKGAEEFKKQLKK